MGVDIYRYNTRLAELESHDNAIQPSFADVSAIRGRALNGCVVRALESAFGVPASELEWDRRVADVIASVKKHEVPLSDRARLTRANALLLAEEDNNIANFFDWLTLRDSEMGHAMRLYHRGYLPRIGRPLSWKQVERILGEGKKVLSIVQTNSDPIRRHMVNVGLGGSSLIARSDYSQVINRSNWLIQRGFVFFPKRVG